VRWSFQRRSVATLRGWAGRHCVSWSAVVPLGEFTGQPFEVWLATELVQGEQALEPEEEGLRVGRFGLARAEEMILDGTIADSATVAAFGLLRLRRPELLPKR